MYEVKSLLKTSLADIDCDNCGDYRDLVGASRDEVEEAFLSMVENDFKPKTMNIKKSGDYEILSIDGLELLKFRHKCESVIENGIRTDCFSIVCLNIGE